MSFASLGLTPDLLRQTELLSFQQATAVQQQAIPAILAGADVLAAAQTGTGKTAAFALPLLQKLADQSAAEQQGLSLILVPTRELANQVADSIGQLLPADSTVRGVVLIGGVSREDQIDALQQGSEIVIATPGRLVDLLQAGAIRFDQLQQLILDEADRMLDLGFSPELQKIISYLPTHRQTLLFSATFSPAIRELARELLNDPREITATPANSAAKTIRHWLYSTDKKRKADLLTELILTEKWRQTLVFVKTKKGADQLGKTLNAAGINSAVIHSDRQQQAREKALNSFQSGRVWVLVATDVASRGLDIRQLRQVVNFDLPGQPEDYIHRIGRTGRAGQQGQAISLVSADEFPQLQAIEQLLGKNIERREVSGFEAEHRLPLFSKPAASKSKTVKDKTEKTKSGSGTKKPGKKSPEKRKTEKDRPAAKSSKTKQTNQNRQSAKPASGRSSRPKPGFSK